MAGFMEDVVEAPRSESCVVGVVAGDVEVLWGAMQPVSGHRFKDHLPSAGVCSPPFPVWLCEGLVGIET